MERSLYAKTYYFSLLIACFTFFLVQFNEITPFMIFPGYILAGITTIFIVIHAYITGIDDKWLTIGSLTTLLYVFLCWLQFKFVLVPSVY